MSKFSVVARTAICAILALTFFSCSVIPEMGGGDKKTDLEIKAVKCILEYEYRNIKKNSNKKIFVHNRMRHFDYRPILGSLQENCKFCRGSRRNNFPINNISKLKFPFYVETGDFIETIRTQHNTKGDYFIFSPLIKTIEKNVYCIIFEKSNSESTYWAIYLLKKNTKNKFEYIITLNAALAFQ